MRIYLYGCIVKERTAITEEILTAVECPKEIIDQIGGWSSSDVGELW